VKVLVLGGNGMLGHKLWQVFRERFEAHVTVRRRLTPAWEEVVFDPTRVIEGVSAEDLGSVRQALEAVRPDAVVNCIGIVKQAAAAKDPIPSITVNSLFPHQLAELCRSEGTRFVHVSTDCVFSGRRGRYTEDDVPDPLDLYGRSKLLGEAGGPGSLTIRTSIIGRELESSNGLVEWFLAQDGGTVSGYKRAIFSGLTTAALADQLAHVLEKHQELDGIRHIAAESIGKYDLLCLLKRAYDLDVEVNPDDAVVIDRSLDAGLFEGETGLVAPEWADMIEAMARDETPYSELRRAALAHR
jgi:dTDP-4-dehydrorhamnose reductase